MPDGFMVFGAGEHSERQRDAGPNINVQWAYGFQGLVSEASVSPPA